MGKKFKRRSIIIISINKKKIWHILSIENIGYVAFKLQNWNTLRVYLFCENLGIVNLLVKQNTIL